MFKFEFEPPYPLLLLLDLGGGGGGGIATLSEVLLFELVDVVVPRGLDACSGAIC
jgi:hypothetical protein